MADFGFDDFGLSTQDFANPGNVVQLGLPPVRIDLMTSLTGLVFTNAWKNRVKGNYGDIPAFFISKTDLIRNKKALGRAQDLSDIEKLRKI